jgi:release factor glutamine methyltransferase
MTVQGFLADKTRQLTAAGITTARLDVLVLLEDLIGKDRAHVLAHPEIELTNEQTQILNEQIKRRAGHVPLAYLRGKSEFYGRDFMITPAVLEPRPESEMMIDILKNLPLSSSAHAIDVGTGSGALAITAKLELPQLKVTAIDIDPKCLAVARKNAAKLQADIQFLQQDLLADTAGTQLKNSVLLCNLPYVPDSFHINQAATHEPRIAIFGGMDGLDVYRKLFSQLAQKDFKPGYVLAEALPPQHEQLAEIAGGYGFAAKQSQDFIQLFTPSK